MENNSGEVNRIDLTSTSADDQVANNVRKDNMSESHQEIINFLKLLLEKQRAIVDDIFKNKMKSGKEIDVN